MTICNRLELRGTTLVRSILKSGTSNCLVEATTQ